MLPVYFRVLNPRTFNMIIILILFKVAQPIKRVLVISLGPVTLLAGLLQLLEDVDIVSRLLYHRCLSLHTGRQLFLASWGRRSKSLVTSLSISIQILLVMKHRLSLAELCSTHATRLKEFLRFLGIIIWTKSHQPGSADVEV